VVSDGDADVGDGAGDEADSVGCGCGRGWRVGRVTGPPLGRADQVRRTSWYAEAAESKVRVALPAGRPRVTVTVSVTLCPAASVPAVLLRLTWFGAELLADQRTAPSIAVRVILPAEPVPTLTLPADSCSVPGDKLVAEPAGRPEPLFLVAGAWAGCRAGSVTAGRPRYPPRPGPGSRRPGRTYTVPSRSMCPPPRV
jgi:hypothetical protein